MTERYKLLYSEAAIDKQIRRMASEITAEHYGKNPLFVSLLRGAAPFTSQLMFEITRKVPDFHPELDYMLTSRYGDSYTAKEELKIITDLSPDTEVAGRAAIILDDVLDRGETALAIREHLIKLGAGFVELAVLVEKDAPRTAPINADYIGFSAPDQWLVGMGMDDPALAKEAYRWRKGIWTVTPDTEPDTPPHLARI